MTVGFKHQEVGIMHQGRNRELTRLAARGRLAELCGSVRHVCSVRGLFRPLGSPHPSPRAFSEFDLLVGRPQVMERRQCRERVCSGWFAVDRLKSSLPGQRGTGTCGGDGDGSLDGLVGDQPGWGCRRPCASWKFDPSPSSSPPAEDLSV
jgi:hypothetical protein